MSSIVRDVQTNPPDKGCRAYSVVFASFLCNGIIFGIINTYSVVFVQFYNRFQENGIQDASYKASLIGSLTIGTTFLMSPISGILIDRIGLKLTSFIGGAIATASLILSSFVTNYVIALFFTYGLLFGIGASLTYTPSLTIVGHYFKKYLGVATGVVTAGSSIFTMLMPFYLDFLLKNVGLNQCLRYESALLAVLMLCSLAFKPLYGNQEGQVKKVDENRSLIRPLNKSINREIWKNKKYVVFATVVPAALCGYFVPYVHMVKFVNVKFPEDDGKIPVVCIAITSCLGRLIFGRISDIKGVNRIFLQQLSLFMIGVSSIIMAVISDYKLLLALNLVLGLFDGCFIATFGPVAFDICGPEGASQAIGFFLGFCSLPIAIGPPIAGWLYDKNRSYTLPFILAGIPPILGSIALTKIQFLSKDESPKPQPEKLQQSAGDATRNMEISDFSP